MRKIRVSSRFKKDFKKYQHKQVIVDELDAVIKVLVAKKKLAEKYRDHVLSGHYVGMRECHVKPDVLLVFSIDEEQNYLALERIGSHSDLF